MTAAERLKEEVEERVSTMRESEDNAEASDVELERTALEDILELRAKDHVAYSTEHGAAFAREWKALQGAARKRLAAIQETTPVEQDCPRCGRRMAHGERSVCNECRANE